MFSLSDHHSDIVLTWFVDFWTIILIISPAMLLAQQSRVNIYPRYFQRPAGGLLEDICEEI